MKKRSHPRVRKCLCCKTKFSPGPHNKHHQRYCGKQECQAASHRASSKRYRRQQRKDPDYQKNEKERVKIWRRSHPGFWKKKNVEKTPEKNEVLRDFVQLENPPEDKVLRDFLLFQGHCLQGLVLQLTGVLRDDIGSVMNSYYDKSKELCPELEKQIYHGGLCHNAKGNHQSGAAATAAGGVRVGRSPPGA